MKKKKKLDQFLTQDLNFDKVGKSENHCKDDFYIPQ